MNTTSTSTVTTDTPQIPTFERVSWRNVARRNDVQRGTRGQP